MALKRRNRIEASFSMASMTECDFSVTDLFHGNFDFCFSECDKSVVAAK